MIQASWRQPGRAWSSVRACRRAGRTLVPAQTIVMQARFPRSAEGGGCCGAAPECGRSAACAPAVAADVLLVGRGESAQDAAPVPRLPLCAGAGGGADVLLRDSAPTPPAPPHGLRNVCLSIISAGCWQALVCWCHCSISAVVWVSSLIRCRVPLRRPCQCSTGESGVPATVPVFAAVPVDWF